MQNNANRLGVRFGIDAQNNPITELRELIYGSITSRSKHSQPEKHNALWVSNPHPYHTVELYALAYRRRTRLNRIPMS